MFCGKRRENCALSSGILFTLLGLFLLIFWEDILQKLVIRRFKLSETSKTYEPWVKSRVPIYVQYYFFNWTNPSDLKDPGYKPELTEVGPYKFWEKIEKVNVTWNENGTVSYRRVRRWYFEPNGSNGTLQDKITTINTIALMAARMVKVLPSFSRFPMNMMIASTQKISVTKTVSEFLFEGYLDPLLTAGRRLPLTSSRVPYDKFGWFYQRNGSSTFDGVYNAQTGDNGMDLFGSVTFWNYKNQTGFYEGQCGQVKGSGGEFWPWNRRRDTDIYLFSPDLCRYIEYSYSEDVTIDGLDGYKYIAGASLFDNGTLDPRNECFCNGQCLASGVLNISVCRFGAPVFTSYPHFYLADPSYLDAFVGLNPSQKLHENYISLEPTYGIPMDIAARIQINVLVQPDLRVALLDGVKQLVFPVLWLDQKVSVPSERLSAIKMLRILPTVNFVLSIIFIAAGVLSLLTFARCKLGYNQRVVNISKYRNEKTKKTNASISSEKNKSSLSPKQRKLTYLEIKSVKTLDTDL